MKKIVLFLCMYIHFSGIYAQHQLNGTVKDKSDGTSVAYATVLLLHPDSSMVAGVSTNDTGRFIIENIKPGDYLLEVSFIGYQKEFLKIDIPNQSDLGDIDLSENTMYLKEVVITGRRALVVQKPDRMVVNVAGNMITSGVNINELLKQMPGLVVDEDGNVKLNGREATIYIDGRPTNLPMTQVAQMLKGMQGDVVDRMELISNPSSRYEAGMSSAIVNIRMKRDASLGINGSVTGGVGITEYDMAWRGGINLNYRSKKLSVFGNYGFDDQPRHPEIEQTRNYHDNIPVTYDQHSLTNFHYPNNTFRMGADWFLNSRQTIGFLFNGTINNFDGNVESNAFISQTGTAKVDSTISSHTQLTEKYTSQMYNLNYKLIASEGEEFTADIDYGRAYNRNWQDMQSRYYDSDGNEQHVPNEFQYSGPRTIDILSLKLDYVKSLSEKSNLEAGIKTGKTFTDNEIQYENLYNNSWVTDNDRSNRFKYSEQISAAYITYGQRFGKFTAMVGLRAEYTSTKSESVTLDSTFTRSYLDWFPSAYLQYQIGDRQVLNFSYSRKIHRPSYTMLNPFRTYIDPFTYESGNPDLNPAYRNTLELKYSMKSYSATVSYGQLDGLFEQEFIQDDVNHITGIVTKNVGEKRFVTLGIFAPIELAKCYKLNIYAETSWNMDNIRYNGEAFKNDYSRTYVSLQHNFTILPTLKANLQMVWRQAGWEGITQYNNNIYTMDARIEKTFLDKRLSLVLSCNDLLSSIKSNGTIRFRNIDQTIRQDNHQRLAMVTIRYNLGSQKIRGARNRDTGIEEEMGRVK